MECTLQSVNILCADLPRQSSFISFLFDVEICFDQNIQYFELGGVRFNMLQASRGQSALHPSFELSVSSADDLKNYQQKFELYGYKSGNPGRGATLTESFLEFEDPSGNLWRINHGKHLVVSKPSDASLM